MGDKYLSDDLRRFFGQDKPVKRIVIEFESDHESEEPDESMDSDESDGSGDDDDDGGDDDEDEGDDDEA